MERTSHGGGLRVDLQIIKITVPANSIIHPRAVPRGVRSTYTCQGFPLATFDKGASAENYFNHNLT